MTPLALEAQVTKLLAEGYEGVTFTEAVSTPVRGKRLSVTFDDAFASVLELGKPILDRLGVPATVFAVTDFAAEGRPLSWDGVDRWAGGPFGDELRSLDWAALRGLADAGWEIGSHTRDHPRLTRCGDEELVAQLVHSRAEMERALGRACTAVAYPYGDADERVERAAADAGYVAGAALPARWHRMRPLAYPRVGVYHGDDDRRFSIKTMYTVRRLRGAIEPRLWR